MQFVGMSNKVFVYTRNAFYLLCDYFQWPKMTVHNWTKQLNYKRNKWNERKKKQTLKPTYHLNVCTRYKANAITPFARRENYDMSCVKWNSYFVFVLKSVYSALNIVHVNMGQAQYFAHTACNAVQCIYWRCGTHLKLPYFGNQNIFTKQKQISSNLISSGRVALANTTAQCFRERIPSKSVF